MRWLTQARPRHADATAGTGHVYQGRLKSFVVQGEPLILPNLGLKRQEVRP